MATPAGTGRSGSTPDAFCTGLGAGWVQTKSTLTTAGCSVFEAPVDTSTISPTTP